MAEAAPKTTFTTSVSENYARYMVPIFFAPFAEDLAARAAALSPKRVLELAAGTGAVTRVLARMLSKTVDIVATDLNPAMLEQAAAADIARPVTWRQADAMALPFEDAAFDLVICQFGVMFFPDKGKAFAEARRVLRPGGTFLFNVWASAQENPVHHIVRGHIAVALTGSPTGLPVFPSHNYHSRPDIERDLRAGGFAEAPEFTTVDLRARAASPDAVALAICQGSPSRNEIESRDPGGLERVTAAAGAALRSAIGDGPVDQPMRAHVIRVSRSP